MKGNAGQVQKGNISSEAIEVREKLRCLDPAEGLGVMGWLLMRMEHNISPEHLDKVHCPQPINDFRLLFGLSLSTFYIFRRVFVLPVILKHWPRVLRGSALSTL